MDRLSLLTAVSTKDQHTTAAIASALGVTDSEADRALRELEREGLLVEDEDRSVNVGPDFNRQFWHLTQAGLHEKYRLEDA
jgi:DNA-binding IclR family transcriptional regulator